MRYDFMSQGIKPHGTITLVIRKALKTSAFGSIPHVLWKGELSHSSDILSLSGVQIYSG